jgi:hypothetical protein
VGEDSGVESESLERGGQLAPPTGDAAAVAAAAAAAADSLYVIAAFSLCRTMSSYAMTYYDIVIL